MTKKSPQCYIEDRNKYILNDSYKDQKCCFFVLTFGFFENISKIKSLCINKK